MVCDAASIVVSIMMNGVCCIWQDYNEKGRREGIRSDIREEYWHQRIVEQELFEARHQTMMSDDVAINSSNNNSSNNNNNNNNNNNKNNSRDYCNSFLTSSNEYGFDTRYDVETIIGRQHSFRSTGSKKSISSTPLRHVVHTNLSNDMYNVIHTSHTWPITTSRQVLHKSRNTSLVDLDECEYINNEYSDEDTSMVDVPLYP